MLLSKQREERTMVDYDNINEELNEWPEDGMIRLEEIQVEMLELLEEARHLVSLASERLSDHRILDRAEHYWLGHIRNNLQRQRGGPCVTLEDTINEINQE